MFTATKLDQVTSLQLSAAVKRAIENSQLRIECTKENPPNYADPGDIVPSAKLFIAK